MKPTPGRAWGYATISFPPAELNHGDPTMKAETFLANLNARATVDGGLTLDVLARHLAETIEDISERNETKKASPANGRNSGTGSGSPKKASL